jgi:hypothetical protein
MRRSVRTDPRLARSSSGCRITTAVCASYTRRAWGSAGSSCTSSERTPDTLRPPTLARAYGPSNRPSSLAFSNPAARARRTPIRWRTDAAPDSSGVRSRRQPLEWCDCIPTNLAVVVALLRTAQEPPFNDTACLGELAPRGRGPGRGWYTADGAAAAGLRRPLRIVYGDN